MLTKDEAKDLIIDTCKTAVQMEIAHMQRTLELWGFKIEDFELCNDPSEGVLPLYVVWLDSRYGIDLARANIQNWLERLPRFHWLGAWEFVVKYCKFPGQPQAEFTFTVSKYLNDFWSLRGLHGFRPKWPLDRPGRVTLEPPKTMQHLLRK
jgi:hypothetical protein